MKVFLASDHTGFELKEKIANFLKKSKYEFVDCGPNEKNPDDDYPDYIIPAAEQVAKDPDSIGIIMGGSGQGEAMAANKVKGARAVLFYAPREAQEAVDVNGNKSSDPFEILKLAKSHNHANILSLGVRFLTTEDALKAVTIWLETPIVNEERHVRRLKKIKDYENSR